MQPPKNVLPCITQILKRRYDIMIRKKRQKKERFKCLMPYKSTQVDSVSDTQKEPETQILQGFRHLLNELATGLGPVTSSLPMRCATACATPAFRGSSTSRMLYYHEISLLSTDDSKKFPGVLGGAQNVSVFLMSVSWNGSPSFPGRERRQRKPFPFSA